jgi:excisionase family DNA binding protein
MRTELLDLAGAAARMKVSKFTVRAWGYQGRIPIVKLGRRTLFREEDIEKFINKGLIEAKQ